MEALEYIIGGLLAVLGPLVTGLFSKLILERIKSATWSRVVNQLMLSVWAVVDDVGQSYVKAMRKAKDPDSPGGTSLTAEEKAQAKALALNRLKSYLGKKGLDEVAKVIGLKTDDQLGAVIEHAVAERAAGRKLAESVAAPAFKAELVKRSPLPPGPV